MRSGERKVYEAIGNRIREAREAKGLTQAELGKIVGYSGGAISDYERAESKVAAADLLAIANALDRPVAYFYGEATSVDDAQRQVIEHTKRRLSSQMDEMIAAMLRSSLADPEVDRLVQRLNSLPVDQRHRLIEGFLRFLPEE